MNRRALTLAARKHRKAVLWTLLLAVALAVVHVFVVEPVATERETLAAKEKREEALIARYTKRLGEAKDISETLKQQEAELRRLQAQFFQGTDPYQLAAALGEVVTSGAAKGLIDLKSYQVLATQEFGVYREVRIRFNFMTTVAGLHQMLTNLENSRIAISFHEVDIQKINTKDGPDLVVKAVIGALMEKQS